ncbi:hypothetical protein RhiirB3_443889 [Rhizophagus irregularis]|nr:hypothetical protein RhiirB3_443889 [Rhizophagus irregularis]
MEETLKQYLNEYYRGFTGFELEHIEDFTKCLKEYKKFNLEEYEISHLDKDMLFPPGDIKIENSQASTTTQNGVTADKEKGATTNKEEGATTDKKNEQTKLLSHYILFFYKDFKGFEEHHLDDFANAIRENSKVNLAEYESKYMERDLIFGPGKMGEGIINEKRRRGQIQRVQRKDRQFRKRKKDGRRTNKKTRNDVLNSKDSEKKTLMSEISTSTYWKDNEIYDSLKQIGYIEKLECKWNYKYRTVRAKIRLTTEMEEIFIKGGLNIAIKKKEQTYFFRMFDAKLSTTEIKKKYEWQAYKKYNDLPGRPEHEGLKAENLKYGGLFSKIIKNKQNQIHFDIF